MSNTPTAPTAEERSRYVSSWLRKLGVTLADIDLTWEEFEDEISEIIIEAERRGAERMRERAAHLVATIPMACTRSMSAKAIRALPLTETK